MTDITIPAEVAKAIVTVMTGVKTLAKDDTNKFQKYDFVSVDRFLEAVGPLCAAAGLVILQEEDAVDVSTKEITDDYGKTKTSAWLTIRYAFTFAHSSGAAFGPLHRTVMVPANGAQAFGSAQSYALKQFMRAQFQIPTGDKDDADHQHAAPLPVQSNRQPPKSSESPKDTPILWERDSYALPTGPKFVATFCGATVKAPTLDAMTKLEDDNRPALQALSKDDYKPCQEAMAKRYAALSQTPFDVAGA